MYRIIDTRGTGKTSRLMLIAKENNAVFGCKSPISMREKAYSYGITGITFVSYQDLMDYPTMVEDKPLVIDDLENFIRYLFPSTIGFTLSED